MSTIREPRRAYRDPDDRFLGGVAGGLAVHLGMSSLRVRLGFLLLTLLGGFGAMVYAGLWVMLPSYDRERALDDQPPGVGAATRGGLRTVTAPQRRRDAAVVISLVVTFIGVVALAQGLGLGLSQRIFWPALVGSAGLTLLWWQSDEAARSAWLKTSASWQTWLRVFAGLVLVVGAISLAVLQSGVGVFGKALATVVLAALGVLLVVGPWLLRTNRELRFERAERIRSQERADVAAHLHDSVLQTLALIQRQAADPQAVARLARSQERELRRWLFAADADGSELVVGKALRDLAADVEDTYAVPVEVVVVGEAAVGDHYAPLVAATREAVQNSAKHSSTDRVDVYAEVGAFGVEIFVRDRGVGFDPTAIAPDRLGVRGSIVDRMARHGGQADVRSTPGAGAEVRLWMPADNGSRRSDT